MRKCFVMLLIVSALALVGCKGKDETEKDKKKGIKEETTMLSLVTDFGNVDDKSFNEGSWNGVVSFAERNGFEKNFYRALYDADSERTKAFEQAVDEGADVVVCPGSEFQNVVYEVQDKYKNSILLIDTEVRDEKGNIAIGENVHCIVYKEEEVGYLAGYAAVKEGYRKLGFLGGIDYDAVKRFGYGYAQGIDAAAKELGLDKSQVELKYTYAGGFEPTEEIANNMKKWYEDGTEVIFSCGGSILHSVITAAEEDEKRKIIGVDVDQSNESPQIIFSAMKGLEESVENALIKLKDNKWKWPKDMAGKATKVGVKEGCVRLSATEHSWRMNNYTIADYNKTYKQLQKGKLEIEDKEMPKLSNVDCKIFE